MKILKTNSFFILLISLVAISCNTKTSANALPKVKKAYYTSYDIKGEKGYDVYFTLKPSAYSASAISINKIKQDIKSVDYKDNQYHLKVIAESRIISGYKVKGSTEGNGIYLKKGDQISFLPVKFEFK